MAPVRRHRHERAKPSCDWLRIPERGLYFGDGMVLELNDRHRLGLLREALPAKWRKVLSPLRSYLPLASIFVRERRVKPGWSGLVLASTCLLRLAVH